MGQWSTFSQTPRLTMRLKIEQVAIENKGLGGSLFARHRAFPRHAHRSRNDAAS